MKKNFLMLLTILFCLMLVFSFSSCQKAEDGIDGITPQLRIDAATNMWEISYDNGSTWSSLGVKATGEVGAAGAAGETGAAGVNGITPQLRVNEASNFWEVSYDEGATWTTLGVKATGDVGAAGAAGETGAAGVNGTTPQLRINDEINAVEVSYDNGVTWEFLGVLSKVSIQEAGSDYAQGKLALFEGYYVGISEEGRLGEQEMLLKDLTSDDVIAVRGVTYGDFPNFGYTYGDRVVLWATVEETTVSHVHGKRYLSFAEKNPANIEDTIVSAANEVTYDFTNVITLDSWSDWQALFQVGTIEHYAYIRISGTVYLNDYAGGKDKITVSRIHMNSAANSLTTMKPDETRCVDFRDNVMTANLGVNWRGYLDNFESVTTYPGAAVTVDMYALYTGANSVNYDLVVLDESWFTTKEAIVKEAAYAFHYQYEQIQYDQTTSRRNLNSAPEAATAQNTVYLDCSSYVNAVYNAAFGVNVLPFALTDTNCKTETFTDYARTYPNNPDVIGYWETADYTTDAEQKALLSEVRGMLQIGDVIVYRRIKTNGDEAGHTLIYVGNGMILHCTGSDYVTNNSNPSAAYDKSGTAERNGAVRLLEASELFENTKSGRYIFNKSDEPNINFSVLRPINRGLTPTEEAINRTRTPGLAIEKTASTASHSAVYRGGEITYSIVLTNHSDKAYAATVSDVLSPCVTFVSCSESAATVEGSTLTCTVDLAAGATVTVTWTVKVQENVVSGTMIESYQTTVNGIHAADIFQTVSGYTAEQMALVVAKAKEYAESNKEFSNPVLMIKQLYQDALGVTVFDYTSTTKLLGDVVDYTDDVPVTDTAVSEMLVPGLYGGRAYEPGYKFNNDIVRLVKEEHLAVGDIIVANYNSNNSAVAFVYLGNSEFMFIHSSKDYCEFVTITASPYESSNVLVTLFAYQKYIVLRPSMVG